MRSLPTLDAAADRGFSSSVQRRLISKRRKVAEQEGRGGSLHRMLTSPADNFAVSVRFFWVHRCFGAPRVNRVGPNEEKKIGDPVWGENWARSGEAHSTEAAARHQGRSNRVRGKMGEFIMVSPPNKPPLTRGPNCFGRISQSITHTDFC